MSRCLTLPIWIKMRASRDAGELPLMLGGKVQLASLTPVEAARTIEAALISRM